jgi:hypothetical protein
MQEDPQAAERRRRGLPQAMDPRNYDPRRAIDPATMERMMRAQAVARAEAQAATTVVIATIVSLVTSAFGFVAALAWNDAITVIVHNVFSSTFKNVDPSGATEKVVYALVATLIAVIVVVVTNRFASRIAKKSAIDAANAQAGL